MQRIYRVEDEDGRGPYAFSSPHVAGKSDFAAGPYGRNPLPHADGIDYSVEHVFGFKTLKQLREWFSRLDRKYMHRRGYVLRVYQAPRDAVVFGKKQVAFVKSRARLVEQLALPVL